MAFNRLNFLPPRIRQERARQVMQLTFAGIAVGVLSIPMGFWYLKWSAVSRLKAEMRQVEMDSRDYAGIIEKVRQLEAQEANIARKLTALKSLTDRQSRWIKLLEVIGFSQAAAQDLWLTSLKSKEEQAGAGNTKIVVTVQGMAFSLASVHEFLRALSESDLGIEFGKTLLNSTTVAGETVLTFTTELKFQA